MNDYIFWTKEAVDAAFKRLKSMPFETEAEQRLAVQYALYAAVIEQDEVISADEPPANIMSDDGVLLGNWVKTKDGKWRIVP